MSGMKE